MDEKKNIGTTTGVAVGFMLALLINIIFILLAIGVGGLYDQIKNKRTKR